MRLRLTLLGTMIAVAGLLAACGDTTTNSNNSRSNVTNLGANNATNGAIVVNSNANVRSNTNRFSNANVTREEVERNRADYERERGDSTIGSGANDMWLWVKTRAALAAADDLRDSTINVDVENEVVTLRGDVASAAQKASAVKVAKGIEGVKNVRDQLKVSADGSTNSNSNANRR
ncbi:MAG TPA: BON domain-containing protein [Pyrinomonadaceae bacterium]